MQTSRPTREFRSEGNYTIDITKERTRDEVEDGVDVTAYNEQ